MSNYDDARRGRDEGMALVGENSGEEWQEGAYNALKAYALTHTGFMTEDARMAAYEQGLPKPHDNRAWGPVINRAVKNGTIVREGFAPAKTGHMRPMPVWRSNISEAEKPCEQCNLPRSHMIHTEFGTHAYVA